MWPLPNIRCYENLFITCFVVISQQVVPWLRRLEAILLPRRPGFDPNSVTSFFEYLKFHPVVTIPVTLYNYSCIYNRRYLILMTDSYVNHLKPTGYVMHQQV